MCLLTTLIAAKGSGIAQLRYKKHEKTASLPKISIIFLTFPRGGGGGGSGRGGSQEKCTVDVSCGQNRHARLPL